jgi:hypothetical protein
MPHENLGATAKFSNNRNSLEINFKSLPSMFVRDGYQGEGRIEAESVSK